MSDLKKRVREVVKLACRNNKPVIHAKDVAQYIECSTEVVEDLLQDMVGEGLLEHFYEEHCCNCGEVIASSENLELLTTGLPSECPGCWTQSKDNDIISAFRRLSK